MVTEREGNTALDSSKWEWFAGLPFLLMGANWPAKFVGVMVGAIVWQMSRHLLKDVVSSSKRLAYFLGIFLVGFVVFMGICQAFDLPTRGALVRAVTGAHSDLDDDYDEELEGKLEQMQDAMEKRSPGTFTDEDYEAADKAARASGETNMVSLARIYGLALRKRLESRR